MELKKIQPRLRWKLYVRTEILQIGLVVILALALIWGMFASNNRQINKVITNSLEKGE